MRHTIGALCMLIVALQILVGVPLVVCLGLFAVLHGGLPLAVEVHAGHDAAPPAVIPSPALTAHPPASPSFLMQPPANIIPPAISIPADNPILASRADHGSPLAGTVLSENVPPDAEQRLFVAALEKVAAENATSAPPFASEPPRNSMSAASPSDVSSPASLRQKAAQFAVRHLYAMANMDERAGEYERADQWRALARGIRIGIETQAPEGGRPAGQRSAAAYGRRARIAREMTQNLASSTLPAN